MNPLESILTAEKAREMFEIIGSDVVWKTRPLSHFGNMQICRSWNTKHAGNIAGAVDAGRRTSYRRLCLIVGKTPYYASGHRLSYLISSGSWPLNEVDHIDHNGLNNSPDNLRDVTHKVNMRNAPLRADNASGCAGVCQRSSGRWRAFIQGDSKRISLGSFPTKQQAIAARQAGEKLYWGEVA